MAKKNDNEYFEYSIEDILKSLSGLKKRNETTSSGNNSREQAGVYESGFDGYVRCRNKDSQEMARLRGTDIYTERKHISILKR
mgnify:CR=1 FL=1